MSNTEYSGILSLKTRVEWCSAFAPALGKRCIVSAEDNPRVVITREQYGDSFIYWYISGDGGYYQNDLPISCKYLCSPCDVAVKTHHGILLAALSNGYVLIAETHNSDVPQSSASLIYIHSAFIRYSVQQ